MVSARVKPLYMVGSGLSGFQVPANGVIGQNGLPPRRLSDELAAGFAGWPSDPPVGATVHHAADRFRIPHSELTRPEVIDNLAKEWS